MAETFFVAFIAAIVVTPMAIKVAPRIGAMDIPKDGRRMHTTAMPRFGGIAILAGIMVSLLVLSGEYKTVLADLAARSSRLIEHTSITDRDVAAAMVGCVLIYILGLADDLKNLKPVVKLAGQTACAVIVFAMGLRVEFITNYFGPGNMMLGDAACFIFTVLWLVGITNAVNLIDGLDGLAAGTSAISALCIGYVAYIHGQYVPTFAMLAIAGGALGFLPYNFHPAKIFMGDGGSQLLGFAIAAFSILGTVKSATMVIVVIPALVLGLPIFDTAFAIVRRVVRHQPIGMADKEHLHHRIMRAGFGQRRSVMLMYCISGIMGIVAVLYSRGFVIEYLGLTAVAIMLLYVLMSDTGNRNVSIRASKIKHEKDINTGDVPARPADPDNKPPEKHSEKTADEIEPAAGDAAENDDLQENEQGQTEGEDEEENDK